MPRASDLPLESMALSLAPPCHSMVIVPFLEEVRRVVVLYRDTVGKRVKEREKDKKELEL